MLPDRVVVDRGPGKQELTIAQFRAIPLQEQVELLFRGRVAFFNGQTQLRTTEALRELRKQAG
jgi:hypothetical protein